jgi:putative ABC transport system permease protein
MSDQLPLVLRLFARFVPGDLREPIAGDLHEEYLAICDRRGPVRAALWLWWHAARLAVTFRWERAAHGRPLPPIGDELRGLGNMWDGLRQDIGFGARMLRRQPGLTAVALLALALGVGANTAIFSIVDAVLWRPLPYPASNDVISLGEQRSRENRIHGPVAPADFYDWRRENRAFSAMAAVEPGPVNISGGAEPERVRGITVTAGFFDVLGIKPVLGRDFRRDEETAGRHRVALLSDGFWRRRFGAAPSIIGQKITLNDNPYDVVGVLPTSFWWPATPDVVLVYPSQAGGDRVRADGRDPSASRSLHSMEVVARLRPGVSFDQARADMDAIGKRLSEQYPQENATHSPHLYTLQQSMVGDVKSGLLVLLGAVGLVLLIACANVAMLLLAKATGRGREIGVRLALGAGRARLVKQLLTESVMLAVVGGAVGVLVAAWGLGAFRALAPASFVALPGIAHVGVDVRVLAVALIVSAATGLVFGVIPALTASDQKLSSILHEEGRGGSASARSARVRAVLVVAELALSLVLLIGAGLLLVSFRHVLDVSPGFEPQNIVVAPIARSAPQPQALTFYQTLLERVHALPSVDAAALATPLPFIGVDGRAGFRIEGRTGQSLIPVRARPRLISAGYFATLGIPLVRGRAFTDRDVDGAPDVVIINAAAARRYWPDEDPVDRRIDFGFGAEPRWFKIVGIVGDVKHAGLELDTDPEAYLPYRQPPFPGIAQRLAVVVRTHAPLATLAPMLRSVVGELDRNQPIGTVSAMEDLIAASVAPRRLNLWLVGAFAVVALVLTAAGLYGVMSYLVAQRTREIGVRMALGASRASVLVLMLRQAGTMLIFGIGIGLVGALALTRFLASLLFGVTASDPAIYAGVSLLLAAVALLAVAVPSSRATRIDPLLALRDS